MCGIVALLSPAIPVRRDLIDAMRDRLAHRGPDYADTWISSNRRVGLAHRRLSIIDTSHAAAQPMATPDGGMRLVYNGEIYNYIELRKELEALGIVFRTQSDTEVLLAALQTWGEGALSRLNGMFAFALWDERTRRLLVARDRFGEKPLFIGRGKFDTVIFASEIKAVLAHPLMPCAPDRDAIERYGSGAWYEDDGKTFFQRVERFPHAHAAWFRADGTIEKQWRYWTPDFTQIDEGMTAREAADGFSERLQRSVMMRLRSDVPVGSSLSGGLDSSAIVGLLARERLTSSFTQNTFSAAFPDDPTISEHEQIAAVVQHTKVNSFVVTPDPHTLQLESARLHWHQEEPFLSASIYLQWCVARLAKDHGTTVLLDGQGADELLGGYQFYFRQHQLDLLDRRQRSLALRVTRKFNRRLQQASHQFHDARRRFNPNVAYSEDELSALDSTKQPVFHYPYEVGVAPARPGGRLRRTLSEALLYNSLPMLLRYADRNAMAFSRETRLPFLDHELVDFCLRVPDHHLIKNGWQKWILRHAAGDAVPNAIRWRADKVGYAAPLDLWLRRELRDWARERLADPMLSDVPGFDRAALDRLWEQHQLGKENHSWALWRWISLAEWFDLQRAGWWRAGATQLLSA